MKGKAAFQNLRGAGKAALREKRVAVSTRVRTQERAQTSYPSFHLKKLDKDAQRKQKEGSGKDENRDE